ncbi:Hsp20/alpha crystallin family protein [Sphaerotilaceae bacterium SBD11-9]
MYRSLFSRDVFAELDRLQREMQQAFDLTPTIRGFGRSGFPALNIGSTPQSVEIYAFAPGLDPKTLEVHHERGLLTIAGERKTPQPEPGAALHINERFQGSFRRAFSLPDDTDPETVQARYTDGVLHISVQRRASAQPRRIDVH